MFCFQGTHCTLYTGCPRRKVNILEGHIIGHSNQKCLYEHVSYSEHIVLYIQGVPGRKVNILEGHIIGHSNQKCLYEHVSYSEHIVLYIQGVPGER